ncbi:hypothetical protein niasHS_010079 [Heterodera schachtii]|uniref:Uncharacterized protein n=1 Tax=Heterodera schachtii TaxID=97005 RepID=A0ABD2J3W7_HETSC
MLQSDCHLPKVPLRYFPYKVPRRFLLAKQRQKLRNSQSDSAGSTFSYENSLMNARLDGCEFDGRSLTSDTKKFADVQQSKQKAENRPHCPSSSASSAFSAYRTAPPPPRPCWLQHFHASAEYAPKTAQVSANIDTTKGDGSGGRSERVQPQQQQTRDLGLAELTDYFQHFVCLCSPRMSDQAQSMYA